MIARDILPVRAEVQNRMLKTPQWKSGKLNLNCENCNEILVRPEILLWKFVRRDPRQKKERGRFRAPQHHHDKKELCYSSFLTASFTFALISRNSLTGI